MIYVTDEASRKAESAKEIVTLEFDLPGTVSVASQFFSDYPTSGGPSIETNENVEIIPVGQNERSYKLAEGGSVVIRSGRCGMMCVWGSKGRIQTPVSMNAYSFGLEALSVTDAPSRRKGLCDREANRTGYGV